MMETRVIKFRAWDKGRNEMYSPHTLHINPETKAFGTFHYHADYMDDTILMQFTGLLDKNGKEIYEGDIVSAWSEGYNHKGEIRWILSGQPRIIIYPAFANQGFWGLHGSERKPGDIHIHVTGKLEFTKGTESKVIDDGVEIIGNIFENPELITQPS